jgi:predicted nucleic acid-binding protein
MYLLDTNIVSYARKDANPAAVWLRSAASSLLYLSVITLGEIERGVAMKEKADRQAAENLSAWLQTIRNDYADRILPITDRVSILWGRLSALRTRGDADGLIAATAIVHGLVLVTRNIVDFDDTGVTVINPWQR